ncbi:hypothetical protein ACSYDW_08145 [Paeniglutamicibacter sp. R2-26]|uniref:hypothetical protein n=1 Tax=Paeniglutamicibacter sp. R2-26 TaxID=3144417 RepID=UPI003EE7AD96
MNKLGMRVASSVLVFLFMAASAPGFAATPVVLRTVTPEKAIRFGPPVSDRVIQSFDFGAGTDVFFVQPSGADTVLSRCSRNPSGGCTQRDSVRLPGYGHGESLEVYSSNGRTYAWLGSETGQTPPFYHSRSISLIEYVKAPAGSKKASYRRIGTIINLAAVAPGKTGPAVRSAVALADGGNRLAIRVQLGGFRSTTYYGIYRTSELTSLMKRAQGQKLSIANAKNLLVSQFTEPVSPNNSFQGFDINGIGTTTKNLYVFGGYTGQAPTIYRYTWTNGGRATHVRTYVLRGPFADGIEAEGIKAEADPTSGGKTRLQIGLVPTERDADNRKIFRLFRFAE